MSDRPQIFYNTLMRRVTLMLNQSSDRINRSDRALDASQDRLLKSQAPSEPTDPQSGNQRAGKNQNRAL